MAFYFINRKQSGAVGLHTFTIHYMELVYEDPNSNETMALVTEELPDKLTDDVQDGWMVIVEDSVTSIFDGHE